MVKSSSWWWRLCHEVSVVLTVLVTLVACGGGGGSTPLGSGGGTENPPPPPPPRAETLRASEPGDLVAYFQARLDQRTRPADPTGGAVFSASPAPTTATTTPYASTTLQEEGVDEDDLLKTNGSLLFHLARQWGSPAGTSYLVPASKLVAHRRESTGQLTPLSSMTLVSDAFYSGLYLGPDAKRVALLGQRDWVGLPVDGGPSVAFSFVPPRQGRISMEIVDVANPAAPASTHQIEIDGRLVGSRLIGNRLYVVSLWSPVVAADYLPIGSDERKRATQALKSSDILPSIRINQGTAQKLVSDTDCYLQPANASQDLQLTTITTFDLTSSGLTRTSRCFVGGSEALYMSATHAYVASTRTTYGPDGGRGIVYSAQASTDIHKFALADGGIEYRGSGNVVGHLGWDPEKKALRMSEHNGDLRVLTFTGEAGWGATPSTSLPASPATLSVLRENTSERALKLIGALPNSQRPATLGKQGEQIYGVRFAGDRAYLVTFRRTDPLYVLDLANPADPRTLGELQAPGYSDYLYPMEGGLLLGVGKDADSAGRAGGVKVALIDVRDPAAPRELATRLYGKTGSASALDMSRHGINFLRQGSVTRVALPVRVNESAVQGSTTWYDPTSQGLVRLEVDHTARTLTDKPTLSSIFFTSEANSRMLAYGQYDVGQERSVQIGAHVFYLSGGSLRSEAW